MSDQPKSFVVIAELSVPEPHRAEFLELCAFDSRSSVQNEPGCRQFDVLTMESTPDMVVLYEVYDDRAAFDAHLATPHYAKFADGVTRLGVTKNQVRFLDRG
ncbi:MAG: antibiotic biosynthesis monooxygenase [Rhodospirillales bacterium]|nr:antibiotic biosynthesis monooxygenase [Acetobacter sp.]